MTNKISEEKVYQAVRQVMHPAISRTLIELGMVRHVTLENNRVIITLALPILSIPGSIKDQLVNNLYKAVASLCTEAEVRVTEMNQEERQAFLAMEQESWKGLE